MAFGAPKPAMYHMLKGLGINPEDLDASIKGISTFTANLDSRLAAMERKLDRLLTLAEKHAEETGYGVDSPVRVMTPEDAGITVTAIGDWKTGTPGKGIDDGNNSN